MIDTEDAAGRPPFPDLVHVVPRNDGDDVLFAELRAVLSRHNAVSRFGISLLHEHFRMEPGELLVESCDTEARTLVFRPVRPRDMRGRAIDTTWRLDVAGDSEAQCVMRCYFDPQLQTHVFKDDGTGNGEPEEPEQEPPAER